jgi:hypothetical protein
MSPYLKIALSLCALAVLNCGGDSASGSATELANKASPVTMQLEFPETPLVDSLTLDCIGSDTLHLSIDPKRPYVEVDLFPYESWKFLAKLYANGSLMQQGEATAKLEAGTSMDITIKMHALAGFVHVEIPLGLGNPAGIASGTLSIEGAELSETYPMQVSGSTAVFTSGMLPLGFEYTATLVMRDSNGTDIYSASETFLLDENAPVPALQIKSLRAKVNLAIESAVEVLFRVESEIPGKRATPRPGDLIISEFMTSPLKSDSTQYEFVEIYNGTLDTMTLEGCTIGTTSQESKGWPITLEFVAPGRAVVLGDTSANTPEEYRNTATWGDFTNTKGSVVLACGGTVIDSLYYSATQDTVLNNLIPNSSTTGKNPLSSHLDIGLWDKRKNPESWCLGTPNPGILDNCD